MIPWWVLIIEGKKSSLCKQVKPGERALKRNGMVRGRLDHTGNVGRSARCSGYSMGCHVSLTPPIL